MKNLHTFEEFINESLNEAYADPIRDIHFEIDPVQQEKLKIAYGKSTGEFSTKRQIEAADYELKRFRKEIKFGDGTYTGIFLPNSYDAMRSRLGNGPHTKVVKAKTWNKKEFQKAKWIDPALTNKLKVYDLTSDEELTTLIKAHTMNAWIHNFETANLIYGDVVQYNHAKQEMHKRNTGSTSGGRGFMDDIYTQNFLQSDLIKKSSYGYKLAKDSNFGEKYNKFNYEFH